ncbi:anti-sigma factor domain-containing protein [Steroidobacter sp.]|uniref:anti-sigma factor n=1 Tax=Steroidobacter sp. TaxID=1978227 RepID=UPI001A605F2B|nr:anti-sigma factor [Steroidobacter sp.]MBL8268558.1 anti-sigma factor [Steroidobacter sp.]
MNYQRQPLIDALASEYVLGTLLGRARRRFEGLMRAYIPARRAVIFWEDRLARLAEQLPAVEPPPSVWARIERRTSNVTSTPPARSTLQLWRALAASFALIAVGVGSLLVLREPQVQVRAVEPDRVAIVADASAPLWLISAFPDVAQLRVRALRAISIEPNRSYELWMIPDAGTAPVSLGLLPLTGETTVPVDVGRANILNATSTLAVSLEPVGGSPTGAPTGPVLYTAALVRSRG